MSYSAGTGSTGQHSCWHSCKHMPAAGAASTDVYLSLQRLQLLSKEASLLLRLDVSCNPAICQLDLYAQFVLLFCCTCDYKCVLSYAQGIPGTIHHLTYHLCPLLCWVFQPTHVLSLFRFSVVLQASYLGAEMEVRTMPQLRGCVVYAVQLSDQTSMTAKALCVL